MNGTAVDLRVFETREALMRGAASALMDAVGGLRRMARVVLAGGSTPRDLYTLLAEELFLALLRKPDVQRRTKQRAADQFRSESRVSQSSWQP